MGRDNTSPSAHYDEKFAGKPGLNGICRDRSGWLAAHFECGAFDINDRRACSSDQSSPILSALKTWVETWVDVILQAEPSDFPTSQTDTLSLGDLPE